MAGRGRSRPAAAGAQRGPGRRPRPATRLAADRRRACGCWSAIWFPDGAAPVAQAYAGHQFGGFVPRLGDGRALLLGELADADGCASRPASQGLRAHAVRARRRRPRRGRTDAARVRRQRGDARAGHPDHPVAGRRRDRATGATGDAAADGAVLARVASSHLRVGTFQYAAGHRRRRSAAPAGRPRDRPALPGRGGGREPVPRVVRGRASPRRRRWWRSGCSSGSCTG